jgi:hypothetical protein
LRLAENDRIPGRSTGSPGEPADLAPVLPVSLKRRATYGPAADLGLLIGDGNSLTVTHNPLSFCGSGLKAFSRFLMSESLLLSCQMLFSDKKSHQKRCPQWCREIEKGAEIDAVIDSGKLYDSSAICIENHAGRG